MHVDSSELTNYKNWLQKVIDVEPVMIVVDNVYELEQLSVLLYFPIDLHPGNYMIMISRNCGILNNVVVRAEVEYFIFNVSLLYPCYAIMLFNWHALNSMEVEKGPEGFAKDIAEACGGLPLALKVSG